MVDGHNGRRLQRATATWATATIGDGHMSDVVVNDAQMDATIWTPINRQKWATVLMGDESI